MRPAGGCTAVFKIQRDAARRRIAGDAVDHAPCRLKLDRIELQSQRRFQRVFPALLDLDRLPQTRRIIQADIWTATSPGDCCCPAAPAGSAMRQQGRFDARQLAGGIADRFHRFLALRFQLGQLLMSASAIFSSSCSTISCTSARSPSTCGQTHPARAPPDSCSRWSGGFCVVPVAREFSAHSIRAPPPVPGLLRGPHLVLDRARGRCRFLQFVFERRHFRAHDLRALARFGHTVDAAGQFAMPAFQLVRG